MVELGQLEAHQADFAQRKVRVVVVSNDDLDTAKKTQTDFPHLVVVSDVEQEMAKALRVLHPGAAPGGAATNAPTTYLVDGDGTIRWLFRADRFFQRLPVEKLLAAVDENG